jgi:hypothetical protein
MSLEQLPYKTERTQVDTADIDEFNQEMTTTHLTEAIEGPHAMLRAIHAQANTHLQQPCGD